MHIIPIEIFYAVKRIQRRARKKIKKYNLFIVCATVGNCELLYTYCGLKCTVYRPHSMYFIRLPEHSSNWFYLLPKWM